MDKLTRNNRIVAITKMIIENPNKVIGLSTFAEGLNAAKSTISEDILIIRNVMNKLEIGNIETISGASGGIKFIPSVSESVTREFADELCLKLSDKNRIIAGNYIYMTDVMFDSKIVSTAGKILASAFKDIKPDYVVTVETKGIPLAYEVAKNLGVELITARRDTKITEGSTVTINYVSGTSGRIQQMSLSKKTLRAGSQCIFIDDFMKGGGTAKGIIDLLSEFDCTLKGIGVLIDNVETEKKLVHDYVSIIDFLGVDANGDIVMRPSEKILKL